MSRPLLAVHVGREVPTALSVLLAAVQRWASAAAAPVQEPLPEGVRAHLYTSEVLPPRPVEPYAVWRLPNRDADPLPDGALVVSEVGTPEAGPDELRLCRLPWPPRARPILPFTRSRYRILRHLPEIVVTSATPEQITWGSPLGVSAPAPEAVWPTLAALSSVVIATGEEVWATLAWAAPTVTDPATAADLSLVPGEHVLVAESAAARSELAYGLAADDERAARLAHSGWAAVRDRTPERAALLLCRRLGLLTPDAEPPATQWVAALDELGAPADSLIRRRARDAVASLPGAVTGGLGGLERSLG